MFAGCRCPCCPESVLAVREVEGRKVLVCQGCEGAFVGAKLGLRLLAVLDADVRDSNASRLCPVCRRAMRSVGAADVEVEVCKAHGLWCDAGELPALVRAVANAVGKPVPAVLADSPVLAQAEPVASPEVHHSATGPSDVEIAKDWTGAAVDEVLSPITDLPFTALSFLDDLLS